MSILDTLCEGFDDGGAVGSENALVGDLADTELTGNGTSAGLQALPDEQLPAKARPKGRPRGIPQSQYFAERALAEYKRQHERPEASLSDKRRAAIYQRWARHRAELAGSSKGGALVVSQAAVDTLLPVIPYNWVEEDRQLMESVLTMDDQTGVYTRVENMFGAQLRNLAHRLPWPPISKFAGNRLSLSFEHWRS